MSSILVLPRSFSTTLTQVFSISSQSISAGLFTTVLLGSIDSDVGNNWDPATNHYIVPSTGLYQITGTLRTEDASPAGTQFSVGVHTINDDGTWLLWHAIQNTINAGRRTTYPYVRTDIFNAGDRLRMFTYSDQGYVRNTAVLNIFRIA